jgi:proton-translocating NADH-quinone oxidoreductase chain L
MPLPAALLLTATLLPLVSFGLLIAIGKRVGNPLAGYVATALIGGSFVCSMLSMISWYVGGITGGHAWQYGVAPIVMPVHWLPVGPLGADGSGWLDVGLFIDSLTVALFATVTLVATLVHIFSIGYMRQDARYPRFFAYLGLFCFAMLGLLLGGTLLHILVFWEGVGACSYLLIGFWYEKRSANNAAIKAFIVNRVADLGLLVGMGILMWQVGNVSLPRLWVLLGRAGFGGSIPLPNHATFSAGWLTVAGVGLFCGAIGKSAQFPLHVWLADAMEGPTPVSALIHAATMVAAGVYLLGRVFPILTPDAKLVIAIVGAVTLLMGALIAVAQTDIKRVLAFSTMSQLGYMVLGMGVGSWVGSLFHLVTHAFFKALLFLGAGSVIQAAKHEQELPQYGWLMRKIPVTAVTFAVGVFALSGVGFGGFGFGGYYSKDMILSHAGAFASLAVHNGLPRSYLLLFAAPAVAAYLTPFYMTRCWTLAFWGRPRNLRLHAGARESPIMWGPLIVLAVLAMISGRLMNVQEMIEGAVKEDTAYCRQSDPSFAGFDTAWSANPVDTTPDRTTPAEAADAAGRGLTDKWVGWKGFTLGIVVAFALYANGLGIARTILRFPPLRLVRGWLYHRMFFDELYFAVVVSTVRMASAVAGWFDRVVIDTVVTGTAALVRGTAVAAGTVDRRVVDATVTGVAQMALDLGATVRLPQTGRVRVYVTGLAAVVAVAAAVAVLLALWR